MAFDPAKPFVVEDEESETTFDPTQSFEIEKEQAPVSGFDPTQPFEVEEQPSAPPVGTSFFEEVAAIPQALRQAIDQPTQAMGETATVLGMPALGETLRGAVEAAEGYVPAAQRFMEPQEGEFQIGGFAPQFLPRAIVEQAGQIAGAIATRAAGMAVGGLAGSTLGPKGTVAGSVAGAFLGPALFEMSQIVGPVARERAANQGREEPTTDDLAWAWGTAGASGALNAIGAKYLPNGDKLVGGLANRIATAVAGEGTTEGLQNVVQQTGQTFLTESGFKLEPKETIGEAIIGGGAAGTAVVAAAPFTPTPEAKAAAAADTKVAAEQAAPVAPETAQIVSEQANQVISEAQAEETAETPEQRVARLQREAQEAAGEIELEEEGAGLPPVEPTPPVTPTPEAAVAPVEPAAPVEGAVGPTVEAVPTEPVAPTEPTAAEPTPAVTPRPAVDVEALSPNAKRANRILTNTGVDPETAAFVAQQYQDEISDLGGEELRAFILDKFEENGGVIPAQMRYSEDQEYYELAFGIGPEEAATLVENAKGQNTQMAQAELEQNKQWRRKDGQQITETQQGVAVAQPEAQAVPIPAGEVPPSPAIEGRRVPLAAPEAAVEPTPVTPPVTPQLEPLRRVARAEQTEEDVAGLVDAGFVEVYNGQPVLTQAGLDALPEAERPRLTPEARKIQIDTRTSEATAEAISKNLRIGVDQIDPNVRLPEGWTQEGDVYVPPQPQAVAPTPEVREARREPAITPQRFYSQLERTVEAKMPNVSSPEQLKAIIDPTRGSGVKPEEVKWSGITEAIDRIASENNGRVPKGAVLKYLRDEGAVKFEEVRFQNIVDGEDAGVSVDTTSWKVGDPTETRGGREWTIRGRISEDSDLYEWKILADTKEEAVGIAKSEAEELLKNLSVRSKGGKPTFYDKWQLAGGENYREVVLTMPSKPLSKNEAGKLHYQTFMRKGGDPSWDSLSKEVQDDIISNLPSSAFKDPNSYTSDQHFQDVQNYVAHMRLNDRKDADGRDGLFIEEIQSDRHQEGREKGYDTGDRNRRLFEAAKEFYYKIWIPHQRGEIPSPEANKAFDDLSSRTGFTKAEIQDEGAARKDFTSAYIETGVPDAPFRKDWPLQMFKRALEEAVTSGKEWIGWTVGETQSERYDLSKQISKVLLVDTESGNQFLYAYGLDGNEVIRRDVRGENIAGIIGKDAAEKLANAPQKKQPNGAIERSLEGVDLKVGASGMEGFYDNILPKEIAKYVKKWGAKVEKDEIIASREANPKIVRSGNVWQVIVDGEVTFAENRKEDAEKIVASMMRSLEGDKTPIWRVNITPEMRRIIQEEGQAVFLRRLRGEPMVGMETSAVEARLQELGFPTGGIIRVVNEPDADFEGRTIILDGKVTGIELNAAAMRDNATIDRVLNHEFAESANADGALNKLVERLTPKEKKEINDTITRLRYEERARTAEEAARAIETLAEAWKGRGFFTRAVARVEAWASKLGFKLTRRAAEYIAARNLADINSGFRTAYNQFINVRGEAREGRAFVTPEENARFLELAKDPEANRKELQKMVDKAAKSAGFTIKTYHGTSQKWNRANGNVWASNKKIASTYGDTIMPFRIKLENPLIIDANYDTWSDIEFRGEIGWTTDEIANVAKSEGFDGAIINNLIDSSGTLFTDDAAPSTIYVAFNPDSLKSSEPVTYDDQGNVIPLEQRFQPTTADIRYARREVRESRREPEAIPTFTEGTPEAATLKEMATSMAKVDAASEAKGGKPETQKISDIAANWMDQGGDERALQDAIVENTNLTPANAARVAKAIAKQYGLQQQIAETGAVIAEVAPEPEGAPRKSAVTKLIEQTTGVRKPVVKLQVSESAALKKQIQLKAREARETRKARKEAAEDLAKAITDYVKANPIRGPINSRQAMSITKRALKLDVNNEAAVDRFEMYVERVIENANYDRDLADARALIKRAKTFAKSKDTQGNVKTILDAIANISPTLLDNPFEFNLVVQRYLLGLAPVTAKQYAVMPDADVRRYLESLETQIKDNQEVLDRAKAQRILDKQAAYAEEKGIPLDEAISILNSEEFLQEKTIEKLEDLTKLLTAMAQESQKDVKAYDDSGATPKQKELISFMGKVNLDSLTNEEKKRYIRFSNNLLANGATFGMEQFQSIALGQEAAMKAVKDRRLSNKLSAWISPIGGDKAIDTARRIALRTQSEADTFKNIFGREAVGAFRNILGLNRLDVAQTDSNRAKEEIANEVGEYYKDLRKKYGDDATGFEAKGYAGVAGYLIQTDGIKTEAESIPYRRRLLEQNIAELRKSDKQSDLTEADFKERALSQLTGTSNAEILSQLQALNPASYEQLMWWKDTMLPKWRDFLKEHDENFRNQANNYNNPDHLTITYKFPEGQLLPNEIEDVYQQDAIGMRIKQAANSIKRKEHSNLPVSPRTGTVANIDINFGYNQYNALVDQVDKAYVAPAWEQVVAFTKDQNFEQIMGGRANALFVKKLLTDIQTSRTRQSMTDDEAQMVAGGVRLARKISTQAVLGGFTQPLRQVPDQLSKLFFTTGRFDLITKNLLATAQAAPLLNKFPIGRRGDAQAGTQYASQFSELARKVEASVTDRKWAQYRELMNRVGEFWMTPLRGSDVWAAKVSWMSYYEAELNKKGIKMESWEREAELVDTDQDRKEAASYAEFAVDFYGGASDPTKMASLSKQTNNGWKEFAKLMFLPLNSFALQQKNSLISDMRDAYLRTGDRKASAAAIAGTLAGMAAFHGMRIYIIGGLVYPAGKALLMGIFGIDMDEPDEEEKQKKLEENWRKFKTSMYGNIVAGGAGQFVEQSAIDAVNKATYLIQANVNPDELLNDKGEVMSFRQYEKEISPLYRFRSFGKSEYTFGLADVLTEQAQRSLTETQQIMSAEEMERYTGNEQAYAMFSTMVEWLYFFRLMDTDVTRIARDLKRQMDKQVEEREAEIRAIRNR